MEWDRHSCLSLRLASFVRKRRQECLRHEASRGFWVAHTLLLTYAPRDVWEIALMVMSA